MKRSLRILSYVFTALITAAVTVFVLACVGAFGGSAQGPSKLDSLENLIGERFIGEYDETEIEDAAASAMVDSLGDRWSYYISAAEYEGYYEQISNSYVGVGITVTAREDAIGLDIIQVTEGGPAEEAGIMPGDVLVAANGERFEGADAFSASNVVKGEEGTTVDLTVRRGEEELTFTVERRSIQVVVAKGEMITDEIGLVTITNFDERCADETIAAIEEVLNEGATSLIFDVRNNPGGYKDELVEILDYLLPEGPLFRSELYDGTVEVDESDADCLDVPMVVLVNAESYSAAEFFAAALREYEVAEVVGEQTVGKGYFQQTYLFDDGSGVGLSVGKYYTPNGVSLADKGIVPDEVVEVDEETFANIYYGVLEPEEDPQIVKAVELLEGK